MPTTTIAWTSRPWRTRASSAPPRTGQCPAKAFEAASRLSESAQDGLAVAILAEIEAAARFDATLVGSGPAVQRLADEALTEHKAGTSESLDEPS